MFSCGNRPKGTSGQFPRYFERYPLRFPYGKWKVPMNSPIECPIDFASCSLRFSYGNWAWLSRPPSYRFWKWFLWVSIWTLTISSPNLFPIIPKGFHMGINRELSRPISYRFWKELFWVLIWEFARSSPNQFPIYFERNSLRFPYGNWPGALHTTSL